MSHFLETPHSRLFTKFRLNSVVKRTDELDHSGETPSLGHVLDDLIAWPEYDLTAKQCTNSISVQGTKVEGRMRTRRTVLARLQTSKFWNIPLLARFQICRPL